jgi:hypothetical protein
MTKLTRLDVVYNLAAILLAAMLLALGVPLENAAVIPFLAWMMRQRRWGLDR